MNKYHNIKTTVDGLKFDSKKEAQFYGMLKLKQRAGDFATFACRVKFPIVVEGVKICTYISDFVTYAANGIIIDVFDCKGVKTPVYQLKKKLMQAVYGIGIKEV